MSAINSPSDPILTPQVSFAVACYNAQPYLREAVESALDQRDVTVEVLIVDDGSTDDSLEEAHRLASEDKRVRVFQTPRNGGPAAARNVAIDNMRGEWFAVLDSDDIIDCSRSRQILDLAKAHGADLIADNLIVFGKGIEEHRFLTQEELSEGRWIELGEYFSRSVLFSKQPALGFLKPMIRADILRNPKLRYNENLRIAEDDELIVRLLNAGNRYFLAPYAGYRYRKHANSISHRLSVANATRMVAAEQALRELIGPKHARTKEYRRRFASMKDGLAFVTSIEHLQNRRILAAIQTVWQRPAALLHYRMPIRAKLARWFGV